MVEKIPKKIKVFLIPAYGARVPAMITEKGLAIELYTPFFSKSPGTVFRDKLTRYAVEPSATQTIIMANKLITNVL